MLTSEEMDRQSIRRPAVAGTWYPASPAALRREVERYLVVGAPPAGDVTALVAPHAGLMFSGPVAGHAYAAVAGKRYDAAVLIGPSHYTAFEGTSVHPAHAFDTPLGPATVETGLVAALLKASPIIRLLPAAHEREHSLEMQLPFLRVVLPDVPIVPIVMGFQTRETIEALADAVTSVLEGRRALLVASTDLSHFFDAERAARLDARVLDAVGRLDPAALLQELESYPEHERGRYVACGGGPTVSVMMAARRLQATHARILQRADSGDVSGDKSSVVGYLAAAIGRFDDPA
jgi:AmmeMemoRadiSam system protein B